jgi:hypothetical protein
MDCFIITSVINTNNNIGWSYTPNRSTYTPDERFRDTLKSIQSIREKVPNSKIVLLEGRPLNIEMEREIIKLTDIYINFKDDPWVLEAIDSTKKGLGEVRKLIRGLEQLQSRGELENINRVFKLSGRYWLNDKFNLDKYSTKEMTFKNYDHMVTTVIYSVPICKLNDYIILLNKCNIKRDSCDIGIEVLFKGILQGNYVFIETLGVEGFVAITQNEFYRA